MATQDERFMARALELAREPAFTSPNPRVGAVVVRDGTILGEGAHHGAGTPHAEAVALDGIDARGATLYVTLEPCAHQGRTPPCVSRIVEAGLTRVVGCIADPDEKVAGKGFAGLASAGIEIETGPLAGEAEELNAAYLHHRRNGDSFVSLKLAQSLDGAIAAPDGSSHWITGEVARRYVHERRQEADAVMVGAGTVLADDPSLTVRAVPAERQPLRIVVDAVGRIPASATLFNDGMGPILVATTDRAPEPLRRAWSDAGADVLLLPQTQEGVDLHALVKELGIRDVVEILCEGGAALASSLLRERLVGRIELHVGGLLIGAGGVRLGDLGIGTMDEASRWRLHRVQLFDNDLVASYRPVEVSI